MKTKQYSMQHFVKDVSLTHGCREGQCSACKSFLLDGDIEMDKYSTFALPEFESEEGYVLLCRSHAYSDLEVELINYDEDIMRLGIPIETFQTTIEESNPSRTTSDDWYLSSSNRRRSCGSMPDSTSSIQYSWHSKSSSLLYGEHPTEQRRLEFIIKVFPGGLFSGLLDGGFTIGQQLEVDRALWRLYAS